MVILLLPKVPIYNTNINYINMTTKDFILVQKRKLDNLISEIR
jgi:hypothetical protein